MKLILSSGSISHTGRGVWENSSTIVISATRCELVRLITTARRAPGVRQVSWFRWVLRNSRNASCFLEPSSNRTSGIGIEHPGANKKWALLYRRHWHNLKANIPIRPKNDTLKEIRFYRHVGDGDLPPETFGGKCVLKIDKF